MNYIVKIPQFEGPFDILLDLIDKQQVEITDIKVAKIADDYLGAIKQMKELDIHLASDFLKFAGILLHLKSKTLIPSTPDWDGICNDYFDDDLEMFEDEDELKQRLMEYRVYKNAAMRLMEFEEVRRKSYERYDFDKVKNFNYISKEEFIGISAEILELMMESDEDFFVDDFDTIYLDEITIEDKMEFVLNILKNGNTFQKFSEILYERKNKIEVVATFLALLELSKMGKITIGQEENFQDITIKLEEDCK